MFHAYILQSEKVNKTYVGFCNDIEARFKKHNAGQVKSTKHFRPWKVIHLETFPTAQEAKKREQYWKSGAGRRKLKRYFDEGTLLK